MTFRNFNLTRALLFSASLLLPGFTRAQETEGDKIIFQAMQDELKRSMDQLTYERFDRPFFISYTITDVSSLNILGSLGAIIRQAVAPARYDSVFQLPGDAARDFFGADHGKED